MRFIDKEKNNTWKITNKYTSIFCIKIQLKKIYVLADDSQLFLHATESTEEEINEIIPLCIRDDIGFENL